MKIPIYAYAQKILNVNYQPLRFFPRQKRLWNPNSVENLDYNDEKRKGGQEKNYPMLPS